MSWLSRLFRKEIKEFTVEIHYYRKGSDIPKKSCTTVETTDLMDAVYMCAEINDIDTDTVSFHNLGFRYGRERFELMEF